MTYTVGKFYWYAWFDDESCKTYFVEYCLRSIRGNFLYFTEKSRATWGKRSKKHGDFGWLDPVPAWARNKVYAKSERLKRYRPTKKQALRAAIADERMTRLHFKDSSEIVTECNIAIDGIKRTMARVRT